MHLFWTRVHHPDLFRTCSEVLAHFNQHVIRVIVGRHNFYSKCRRGMNRLASMPLFCKGSLANKGNIRNPGAFQPLLALAEDVDEAVHINSAKTMLLNKLLQQIMDIAGNIMMLFFT